MQPRDALTDNLATHFPDRSIIFDEPRPFPLARRGAAVVAAWLVPGAGHLVLGKRGRALLFFLTIIGAFVLGLILNGHLYWPTVAVFSLRLDHGAEVLCPDRFRPLLRRILFDGPGHSADPSSGRFAHV